MSTHSFCKSYGLLRKKEEEVLFVVQII